MRWLGIDHGTKRIGLAVGGTADGIAAPVTVLDGVPEAEILARILAVAAEYEAGGIVVGWPLNMDDTEGPQGKLVRAFAERLAAATRLDVRLWDERLSSFQADQALAGAYTRKQKKARQDAVAAAAMLQDFLASGGPDAAPTPAEARRRAGTS